tara:strand:+ start:9445 stop:11226 length:1782 start_codon:yes stop_codon:yes gene_type:complete
MELELTNRQKKEANDFANLLSYIHTDHSAAFLNADYDVIFDNKGNQAGGTAVIAYGYVLRILGWHPIPKKNMVYFKCETAKLWEEYMKNPDNDPDSCPLEYGHYFSPKEYFEHLEDKPCPECGAELMKHERINKVYRFASQALPSNKTSSAADEGDRSGETTNTQYPEFNRWLPPFLLKKDITARESVQVVRDPYGGKDIIIEYTGYTQPPQRVAGHKRTSVWLDELAPEAFFDEQPARLMIEDGDIMISYTPTRDNGISYYYDRIYERAKVYYRSRTIRDYYKRKHNIDYPEVEFTNSKESIAIIEVATDDNPLLTKEVIDRKYAGLDDEQLIEMRRYGIFTAVTGKIYKQFTPRIHMVKGSEVFPEGIPDGWTFFRSEDWHPTTKLAIIFVAMSPYNEAFVYAELNPDPERDNTLSICRMIADVSGETRKFGMNLIDPLASIKQSNTTKSVIDDMNYYFKQMAKNDECTGGWWESANTKSTASKTDHNLRGRDEIRRRLGNALMCKRPFNNQTTSDGLFKRLPTLWILNDCPLVADSLKSWRLEKNKPTVRWSHFCTALEFLMKDVRFAPRTQAVRKPRKYIHKRYYQTSR